ncbi:MAG TPA: carboxypeptidase regulatory-like domain-containing protein [Candidatus Angelobacter sp.]|nr:carboxypeptidase regulatory-like domain-containing protein [Candidatus Angelobacter sp.]
MRFSLRGILSLSTLLLIGSLVLSYTAAGQSSGNSGTIQGTVVDPSGAVVPGAKVSVKNAVTGYSQEVKSGDDGTFKLTNLPPNPYHLEVTSENFSVYTRDVPVRGALPVQLTIKLGLAASQTVVNVEAGNQDVLEVDTTAHTDADRNQIEKLPIFDPGAGLSQAIINSTGGVATDGNGFFHPLGDHAQVLFVIDNQPISDQQSKVFSTQLPISAVQSMELDTGAVTAEFGDKTSLVAQVTTRSGLGSKKVFGNVTGSYGSFGTATGSVGLGWGNDKYGNFFAADGVRSGRFLDSPELAPIHDIGNNETLFDRADWQVTPNDILHLNLFTARNWIQIPNNLDQVDTLGALSQDQRQKVVTWSIAPGYQHIFNQSTLLSINPYVRQDQFDYYPSKSTFADQPTTQGQNRHLLNYGVKSDLSKSVGRHTLKVGIDMKQTRLLEEFTIGATSPTFNAPCLNADGTPDANTALTDPGQCTGGLIPNTQANNPASFFNPAFLPFDLTRGGALFRFHGTHNINQYAFYAQDSIKAGNFLFSVGIRGDVYDGLVSKSEPEPRVGIAYNFKRTGTVLRVGYSRTLETPFNENLLLSSGNGLALNIFGATSQTPIQPGFRNQFNGGLQQAIGKWLLVDADYFWKYTHNAFDFNALLGTTITFPIAWHNSKLDGVSGRVSTTNIHGFQAYYTFGHTRARYFPPETGGITAAVPPAVFRIDHDQAFQNTLNFRYQRPKGTEYFDWIWRFDSGLVVSGVPDVASALTLTPNQQVTLGLACNGVAATLANPFNPSTPCGVGTSKLLVLPQTGTENDDHNPDRVKPRNVLDLGLGSDNLFHTENSKHFIASVQIINLTNKVGLYNFLSTFSGTHFMAPRTVVAKFGYTF